MMHRTQLLADLQTLLRRLEADLLERSEAMIPVKEVLRGEHQRARTAERTAQSYEAWRSDYITQMAAAWVLSGVFVRFLEDNRLIDPPRGRRARRTAVSCPRRARTLLPRPSDRNRPRVSVVCFRRAGPLARDARYLWRVQSNA